jgi:hypothetical protein
VVSATSWRPSVGHRVRVCHGVGTRLNCAELPHYPVEAGRTATVHADHAQAGAPGHPFLVIFDHPAPVVNIMGHCVPLPARHYAAAELEPLDRSAAADRAAQAPQPRPNTQRETIPCHAPPS